MHHHPPARPPAPGLAHAGPAKLNCPGVRWTRPAWGFRLLATTLAPPDRLRSAQLRRTDVHHSRPSSLSRRPCPRWARDHPAGWTRPDSGGCTTRETKHTGVPCQALLTLAHSSSQRQRRSPALQSAPSTRLGRPARPHHGPRLTSVFGQALLARARPSQRAQSLDRRTQVPLDTPCAGRTTHQQ